MAKLSREELMIKIDSLPLSDDDKISLMEDVSDSLRTEDTTELEAVKAELEQAKLDIEDLKAKYKARFLSGEVMIEDNQVVAPAEEEVIEEVKESEEPEVVDVQEIFTEEILEEEKKEEEANE